VSGEAGGEQHSLQQQHGNADQCADQQQVSLMFIQHRFILDDVHDVEILTKSLAQNMSTPATPR
jgi:hypothetical protein